MDYSTVSRRIFYSHPNSKMVKTFHLPSDPFVSPVLPLQRERQFCASCNADGISSLNEREARGSPYINTDDCLNEHSSVDDSHTPTSQKDLLTVVTSSMNDSFIVTPVNKSQSSGNKTLSCAHNTRPVSGMSKGFVNHAEQDGYNERVPFMLSGREEELTLSETPSEDSSGDKCNSLSSGEMVVRSHSFCLEEESLIALSSLEDSSISPAASCLSGTFDSNLLSAALPDVCKTSRERTTKQTIGHHSLDVTFTQANSVENLSEENDIATSSFLVTLPSESEGGLFTTFICETPTDQTKKAKSSSSEAELLPQVSEEFAQELGKTFVSTMSEIQDSDEDIHTSTPVQNIENKIPNISNISPCTENAISPSFQLEKGQQISNSFKGQPVAGITPSVFKVKKTELQKGPKCMKSKVSTGIPQQTAVAGTAKLQRSLQVKHSEVNKRTTFRITAAKVMDRITGVTAMSKTHDPNGNVNTRAATSGVTMNQLRGLDSVSSPDPQPAVKEHVSVIQGSEGMRASARHVSEASAQHATSLNCASSAEKSPGRSGHVNARPTPKKDVSSKIGVSSASGRGRLNGSTISSRFSAKSLTQSRPLKDKKAAQGDTASFTVSQDDSVKKSAKTGDLKCHSQCKNIEKTNSPPDNSRGIKKISLVAEPCQLPTAKVQLNKTHSRSQGHPSTRRERGASLSQPPAASPKPTPLFARKKQGTPGRSENRISRTVGHTQSNIDKEGSHRTQETQEPSIDPKPQQNSLKPSRTPSRSSLTAAPLTPAVRLPTKTQSLCQDSKNTPVSGGAANKPTPFKSFLLKARLIANPAKNSGSAVTTVCSSATSTGKGSSIPAAGLLRKTSYGKPGGKTTGVDKNKPKTNSQQHQQNFSKPAKATSPHSVAQESVLQNERRDQNIQKLKELLTASDCRFQGLAIVLQQTLAERDEATRQCRKLSQELVSLKAELACSVQSSDCLEREKEELRAALQDATQKLQEEHKKELTELEQKLQAAFKAEWDHVYLTYQEEANKYKTVMQQQIEELKANHETMQMHLQSSHAEQLQSVREQYEISLEELRKSHTQELQSFEQALKEREAILSAQIQELTVDNNVLLEKLAAEESRRRGLGEDTQKDSHTLYLEQELESLKVVLDIKNNQLHQQEKKMMEVAKLTERNVKLDEILTKVQQENEDLKARMERHAALSRQLSTEQAMLQESLQKESKVNKRLSMENEELLWKLHNGDLSSPQRVSPSPTSPSLSFKLQSPRSSGFFSNPTVSPR